MPVLGLIKEGKVPNDNRVALTPKQCKWLKEQHPDWNIIVEASPNRCYKDEEYSREGIELVTDISKADILLGIKEVPKSQLIAGKTYLFFSHTKKAQPYNQALFHSMMDKGITLIDYECLEHEDGQRLIGFGFFAGIVGAHNGIMAYGNRTKAFHLGRVKEVKDYRELIHTYFGLKLPPVKIVVTGSGRVAHGILEIMNLMDVQQVEPDEFDRHYAYPVYVHLKGRDLYKHKLTKNYERNDFHAHPENYDCTFKQYLPHAQILMNGIYWEPAIPPLFTQKDLLEEDFVLTTIADITDDAHGSVPCNLGDAPSEDPVYGVNVNVNSFEKTAPYLPEGIDIMAVGNLPNELPRDASRFFGEQLIKYVLPDLVAGGNDIIQRATMLEKGILNPRYDHLVDYAKH